MSTQVLVNAKCFLGEQDFTGEMNRIALNYAAELVDDTVFEDESRSRAAGLTTIVAQLAGYVSDGDAVLHEKVGLVNVPMSIIPSSAAEGDRAYTFLAAVGEYSPQGAVGEMYRYDTRGEGCGTHLVRGVVGAYGAKTATGTGAAQNLGLLASGKTLYAALHVFSASGTSPTLDVVIESDDGSGFASGTTRITFDQVSDVGYAWKELDGPIADDTHWRVSFTIGGTDPSFTFAVVLGIQ